jgi:hypothetical protein
MYLLYNKGLLIYVIVPYVFDINTTLISSLACKIYKYMVYALDITSVIIITEVGIKALQCN